MRSEAVRWARFDEFDLAAAVWTIPQARMKALRPRPSRSRSARARSRSCANCAPTTTANCCSAARTTQPPDRQERGRQASTKLLKAIGHDDHAVAHGFRSTLKDWVHETRDYPAEVIEQALGHRIKSSVERAYRRGDLFDRRKLLMLDWEGYCNGVEASARSSSCGPDSMLTEADNKALRREFGNGFRNFTREEWRELRSCCSIVLSAFSGTSRFRCIKEAARRFYRRYHEDEAVGDRFGATTLARPA